MKAKKKIKAVDTWKGNKQGKERLRKMLFEKKWANGTGRSARAIFLSLSVLSFLQCTFFVLLLHRSLFYPKFYWTLRSFSFVLHWTNQYDSDLVIQHPTLFGIFLFDVWIVRWVLLKGSGIIFPFKLNFPVLGCYSLNSPYAVSIKLHPYFKLPFNKCLHNQYYSWFRSMWCTKNDSVLMEGAYKKQHCIRWIQILMNNKIKSWKIFVTESKKTAYSVQFINEAERFTMDTIGMVMDLQQIYANIKSREV